MKLSNILQKVWPILRQTKNYARIAGVILFLIGLFGFAFRSDDSLPDVYLAGALILGFWGIVSGLWDSGTSSLEAEAEPDTEPAEEPSSATTEK